jgi:hypothetical protein
VASPNPAGLDAEFNAVSCASATFCMAVGWKGPHDGSSLTVFAERWNGTSWSLVNVPGPSSAVASRLLGVSCTSGTYCLAVGASNDDIAFNPLARRWNGTAWSVVNVPTPTVGLFRAVACVSTTDCRAVGDGSTGPGSSALIEKYNGSSWTVQSTYGLYGRFSGVACVTASNCTAAGSTDSNATLAAQWNGSTWSQQTTVDPPYAFNNEFDGVACPTTSVCVAVGFTERTYPDDGSATSSLIERRS